MMRIESAVFNPAAQVERIEFGHGLSCLVVDDALRDPEALREFAVAHRAKFRQAPFNAYPGIELPMPATFSAQLDAYFMQHIRTLLGGRRTVKMNSRMAMVTAQAGELEPRQRICHRDSAWIAPEHMIAASVLYLFEDPRLGGTSFYRPSRTMPEIEQLVHDSSTLDRAAFDARHRLAQDYMSGSNEYFERIGQVAARWNRIIFYDGRIFHSGEVGSAQALSGDPMSGRLTVNGFFTCTRKAA